jgi:hypothetical protein
MGTATNATAEWTEGSTDDHGYFGVPDIVTGQWEVEICADGYRPMHVTAQIDPRKPAGFDHLTAIRKTTPAADRVRVLEPSSVVRLEVGTPVHLKWRVENGPVDPKGWEIRVSIWGCADAEGLRTIHAEPFTKAEGGFTWRATKDVVDWIAGIDDWFAAEGLDSYFSNQDEMQLPVQVCLYNAAGRNERPGVVEHEDELLAMSETCHAAADQSWLVCGDTADDGRRGRIALRPRRPEEIRALYEALHPALHVAGDVVPPKLISRAEPDWKDRGSHQPVTLEAVIMRRGFVDEPVILSAETRKIGHDAVEAFKRWKYEPAMLDGEPVDVFVTVVFTP